MRVEAEQAPQLRPPQLRALTSVRFFAALHVALYHMVRPFSLWGPLTGFVAAGYTGVSFFFLLSGFILTYSHAAEAGQADTPAFRHRFYFARFARIYPTYLLVLLAAGWLLHEQFTQRLHALAFAADLVLLQSWSLRMVSFFNVPAWSVSSEMFFYAVFPFALARLRPASRRAAVLSSGLLWVLAMAAPVFCLVFSPEGAWHEGAGLFAFWVRRFPPLALPEFLAGAPLGWLLLQHRPSRRLAVWMTALGLGGVLAALLFADLLPAILLHNGLLIPLYALVLLGLSGDHWLSRALAWRPLVVLGEASYALYLTHFLFNDWIQRTFHTGSGLGAAALKLLCVLPLSLALHFAVERPARGALLRGWGARSAMSVVDRPNG